MIIDNREFDELNGILIKHQKATMLHAHAVACGSYINCIYAGLKYIDIDPAIIEYCRVATDTLNLTRDNVANTKIQVDSLHIPEFKP